MFIHVRLVIWLIHIPYFLTKSFVRKRLTLSSARKEQKNVTILLINNIFHCVSFRPNVQLVGFAQAHSLAYKSQIEGLMQKGTSQWHEVFQSSHDITESSTYIGFLSHVVHILTSQVSTYCMVWINKIILTVWYLIYCCNHHTVVTDSISVI